MQTRCYVALGGNFGFELDLTRLSGEDRKTAGEMIRRVKQWRHLTGRGIFSRLVSPEGSRYAAWQFLSQDGREALLCTYRILSVPDMPAFRFRMTGLDPSGHYRSDEGKVYTGAQLMFAGISTGPEGDFSSRVIHFTREA